ncbi:hypothetical protein FMUND_13446 [Fusarium mundagurra]|uniref:Uncharacterized protein n=1 Tax=Fusarium mundagurra TaxID=1567541 RepID=A0A8H5Y0D9_9HYPO|nr:hypothetical protein FMUND_13446 [Fusarium mundagurra]
MFLNHLRGNIDAILDAPSIMINGKTGNSSEIYYILRIKSGKIFFRDGKEREFHDWEVAFRTSLEDLTLTPSTEDSPDMAKRKKRWGSVVANKFPGFNPGDYSVHRIFCALGNIVAQQYVDSLSSVWDPASNQRIKLSTWFESSKNSIYRADTLEMVGEWIKKQEDTEKSTMGIRFTLDPKQVQAHLPTFRPVHQYTQIYPYLAPGTTTGTMGYGRYDERDRSTESPCGILEPGDYNCLLYCENVDLPAAGGTAARPLPTNKKMSHNGNLAEPTQPQILGSFLLDHRIFMKTFLLPQLQELCQATWMQVERPSQYFDEQTRQLSIAPQYAIGCPLKGASAIAASDEKFKFKEVSKSKYVWEPEKSTIDGRGTIFPYYSEADWEEPVGYGTYWIQAASKVELEWHNGQPNMDIRGEIVYKYQVEFSNESTMTAKYAELDFTATSTWSLVLVLQNGELEIKDPKTGVKIGTTKILQPTMKGVTNGKLDNLHVQANTHKNTTTLIVDTTKEDIQGKLAGAMQRAFSVIVPNITSRFQDSGKLSYPGYGELELVDPRFTAIGNLIASVAYKKPTLGDGKMYFPPADRAQVPIVEPSKPPPDTSMFKETLIDNREPTLEWRVEFKYNEKTRVGRLKLQARNNLKNAGDLTQEELLLLFSEIRIQFIHTPNEDPKGGGRISSMLFNDSEFTEESPKGAMEKIYNTAETSTGGGGEKMPCSNMWHLEAWDSDKSLEETYSDASTRVKVFWDHDIATRSVEIRLRPTLGDEDETSAAKAFIIPHNSSFTLQLQGPIEALGEYAIKIQEEWCKLEGEVVEDGANSIDFRWVTLKQSGSRVAIDCYDVSERRELEKTRKKKEKSQP